MSQFANGFAMNDGVAGVLKSLAGGLPGGAAQTMVRPWRFYHKVAYAAAGQANLNFFNVGEQNHITNWKQAGQLPNNYGFALQSVGAKVYSGFDITGTAVAAGALSARNVTTVPAIVEQLRILHETAKFTLEVNDKRVMDVVDITCIPPGRGMDVSAALFETVAATISAVNNSAPLWGNRQFFDTPWPISGGQTITCRLDWPGATTAPLTGGGVAMVEFIGLLISPAGL